MTKPVIKTRVTPQRISEAVDMAEHYISEVKDLLDDITETGFESDYADLLREIGLEPDRNYSVGQLIEIRNAIASLNL